MQVTKFHLTLHDSLYYATREMGRLYETEKVIHNWALTYALGLIRKPYRSFDSVPTYQDDLTPTQCGRCLCYTCQTYPL